MRIITVEEHFHHPEAVARVLELAGPGPVTPDAGFGDFIQSFMPDRDSTERLGGKRLEHMDRVGIDVQVVSHGANNPGSLNHPEAVELCRKVNNALAQPISEHPSRFRGFATLSGDFPYVIRDNVAEFLEQADLTDDQRNAIGHGNAENVMRL
jgi:predicted TIM-barrel fold metal-dependent hydrolase